MYFKKILLFLVFMVWAFANQAQFGVNLSFLKPSSTFGSLFSPSPELEFTYQEERSTDLYMIVKVGFFGFKPRKDTFDIYYDNRSKIIPGYKAYSKFYSVYIGTSLQRYFFESEIRPFIGFNSYIGLVSYDYESHIKGISTRTYYNLNSSLTLGLGIGASYRIDEKISYSVGIYKNVIIDTEAEIFPYFNCFSGINIQFK